MLYYSKNLEKKKGFFFDQRILKTSTLILDTWKAFDPEAIIPIPQFFFRTWEMRGNRSASIASWISKNIQIPILYPLKKNPLHNLKRQAEMSFEKRLQSETRFSLEAWTKWDFKKKSIPKRVLLVDDFMTSGRTFLQAAHQLQIWGVEKIHAFSLGLKAPKIFL